MVEIFQDRFRRLHMYGVLQAAGRQTSSDVRKKISGQLLYWGGVDVPHRRTPVTIVANFFTHGKS